MPAARDETPRQAILRLLREGFATIRDLSQGAGLSEADVVHHLDHLRRSLEHTGEDFMMETPSCLSCGFGFEDRRRLTRPGRCPSCHGSRISWPRFRVV